jgi:membrane associated rhomboid family serine protease
MIPLRDNSRLGRAPFVTIALVVANVVVYVLATRHGWQLFTGPSEATGLRYGAIPYTFGHYGQHCAIGYLNLITGQQGLLCSGWTDVVGTVRSARPVWETAFTAMFLHANLLQLMWNMAFLGAFGCAVEDRLGHLGFLAFYVLGGFAGLAVEVLFAPRSTVAVLGSSGAIAAVIGSYIVLYPRGRFLTLLPLIVRVTFVEQPAWLMLAVWLVVTVLLGALGLSTPAGADTALAISGQIGSFAFGVLVAVALAGRVRARIPGASSPHKPCPRS